MPWGDPWHLVLGLLVAVLIVAFLREMAVFTGPGESVARVAMTVAIAAALGAMVIGATLAYVAGYFGGAVDWLIGRTVDVWMSFPPVILSLILMVGFGTGLRNVILAIVLVDWTRFCRVLRSEVLVLGVPDPEGAVVLLEPTVDVPLGGRVF